ncbi:hypothetical protein B296_00000083 [Ensete ventricosum]|uniref:Uncharacterized protein n=1 Tax=Ensete ventricosum TaxID=4639 RepID=A0A427AZG9_ENSVE|nr:hypothetical protein B296_00000083 [Ensete ventricosum]
MCGCCDRRGGEEEAEEATVEEDYSGEQGKQRLRRGCGYGWGRLWRQREERQRWLRLRAREAAVEAALAAGRSRGERRGLCAGGATVEEEGSDDVKRWWVVTGRQMQQWQAAVKKVGWKRQMREERKTTAKGLRLLRQERRKGRAAWQHCSSSSLSPPSVDISGRRFVCTRAIFLSPYRAGLT